MGAVAHKDANHEIGIGGTSGQPVSQGESVSSICLPAHLAKEGIMGITAASSPTFL